MYQPELLVFINKGMLFGRAAGEFLTHETDETNTSSGFDFVDRAFVVRRRYGIGFGIHLRKQR